VRIPGAKTGPKVVVLVLFWLPQTQSASQPITSLPNW
jgi:hypothetical protein